MKKICIITAARSEYGYLKWLMLNILKNSKLELSTIITGGHLNIDQGYTIDKIIEDNIPVSEIVDSKIDNTNEYTICESLARMQSGLTKALYRLKPECVVVVGDRYELLSICSTVFLLGIPIAHIAGGDVTEGAIDDAIRNAVTMLSKYHFPISSESAKNIARMRNSGENIFTVGSTSLDFFNKEQLLSRKQLSQKLDLEENKQWCLCTFHSETKKSIQENLETVSAIVSVLLDLSDFQIIFTKANTDLGGKEINEYLELTSQKYTDKCKLFSSLGQLNYFSTMKQVKLVIGNSSSGILESPFLAIPTVNIGDRQKGRYQCDNIVQSDCDYNSILNSVQKAITMKISTNNLHYWGNGDASDKIMSILEKL